VKKNPTQIKCLTVKRPWSGLIVSGIKTVENRSRPCKYRGRLYIHAGLGVADSPYDDLVADMAAGAIIGHVDLVDCIEDSEDPFAVPGFYHWILTNPVEFAEPIFCSGKLGMWRPPTDVLAQLPGRERLRHCSPFLCDCPVAKPGHRVSSLTLPTLPHLRHPTEQCLRP
jgi:hypothetical protein